VKDYFPIFVAVIGVVLFMVAWKLGYVAKLSTYVGETQQELKKCNWPTRDELMDSTLLIFVIIALLGLFTMGVDQMMILSLKALLKGVS
jgi:preprotein translocase SecE subunit